MKYVRNFAGPNSFSSTGPKLYSTMQLISRWSQPPCRNAEVTSCHGRKSPVSGFHSANRAMISGSCHICRANAATQAISRLRTTGVSV
jgi:hypothetical protein